MGGIRPDVIRPKAPRPATDPGQPEITTRMVLEALRLLAEMGANGSAAKLVRGVAESIGKALRRYGRRM